MEYVPSKVRGSGAAASAGGAGGAEARTEAFLDPASSTTAASWITISSASFFLHSQRLLQRQPQQQTIKIMPLISKEMRDKLSLMKFPLVWGSSVIASPMGSVVDGAAVDSIDVGSGDGAMDGLCVVGPSVGFGAGAGEGRYDGP